MGSPCEVQLYAEGRPAARRAAHLAIAEVQRLEARYSRYRPDSLLSEINRVAAAGGGMDVDEETASLLNYADACYRQSEGLFDISSGILRRAWRFVGQGGLPDPEQIQSLLDRVGWHRLRWNPPRLEFMQPGMEIDFGGVVKEYGADRVAALCRESGVRHGLVNLGGDIRIIGPHPDGAPWQIGIRHPRPGEILGTLPLVHGGVASSGDYERCVVVEGVRYGHVLNPRTGWPVRRLSAVTVVGELCVVAGSASTIAMLKEEDGSAWLAELGLPHFWVDVEGRMGGTLVFPPESVP